jgi:hypothetical protein
VASIDGELPRQYPKFYDLLFALQVLTESGHAGDPRMADARALLIAKCLPDGGFPCICVRPSRPLKGRLRT